MISLFSECGAYHCEKGQKNQDYVISAEDDRFLIIALADGVSSRSMSAQGARAACREIKNMFMSNGKLFFEFENEKISFFALSQIIHKLEKMAEEKQVEVNEFASTISFAFIDKKKRKMIILNLGDNIILSSDGSNMRVEAAPENDPYGCRATTTEGAYTCADTKKYDCNTLDSIVIMSDGAWEMVYERGIMKCEYEQALMSGDYNGLCRMLKKENCYDDYSFAAVDLKTMRLRGDF